MIMKDRPAIARVIFHDHEGCDYQPKLELGSADDAGAAVRRSHRRRDGRAQPRGGVPHGQHGVRRRAADAADQGDELPLVQAKVGGDDYCVSALLAHGRTRVMLTYRNVATFPPGTPLPAEWLVIGRVMDGAGVTVDGKMHTGVTGWDHFR